MATPLQSSTCYEWMLYAVMLFCISLKNICKIVWNCRKTSELNNQQIRQGYNMSVNNLLRKDDFERNHKKLSFILFTKCDYDVYSNKGLTISIPGFITVVSNPTIIQEQSKRDIGIPSLRNKSHRTHYSTQEMQTYFPSLFTREYTSGRNCENITTEKSHDDAASYMKHPPGHEVGHHRRHFCPRTHRPVQVIPCPPGERSILQTLYTDSSGYVQWNQEQIIKTLKERRFLLPGMTSSDSRRNTFVCCIDWYYLQFNTYWPIDDFINAGFYLKDNHGNLECFSCGLQIRHEIDDYPYRFHQNYSPHCLALTRVDKEVVRK